MVTNEESEDLMLEQAQEEYFEKKQYPLDEPVLCECCGKQLKEFEQELGYCKECI